MQVHKDILMKGKKRKVTQSRIEYILFLVARFLLRILPYKLTESIITNIFRFGGLVIGIRKKIALNNLNKIFPDKTNQDKRRILSAMYRNFGKTTAEIYFGDLEKLSKKIDIQGWDNLEKAIALKKGVLLASLHIGNWESAGLYISQYHKISVIYKSLRNRFFDDFNNRLRERNGVKLINIKSSLISIIKLLKQNYIVTILIDQNARKKGELIDFLGYEASTYTGISRLALKTNTPIVPAISIRQKNCRLLLIFEEIINAESFKNSENPILDLLSHISKKLEKYILEYPEQWFWVHKRWHGASKLKKSK